MIKSLLRSREQEYGGIGAICAKAMAHSPAALRSAPVVWWPQMRESVTNRQEWHRVSKTVALSPKYTARHRGY